MRILNLYLLSLSLLLHCQARKNAHVYLELGEKHIGDLHTGKKHTEFCPFGYLHMMILAQKPHAHQEFCTSENCTFRMEETFASTDYENFVNTFASRKNVGKKFLWL